MPTLVACPHCGKGNPLPASSSAQTGTCQWCHRKYELIGDGQAVAPAPRSRPAMSESLNLSKPCTKCGSVLPAEAKYCLVCGEAVPEPDTSSQVVALRQEIAQLRGQVESLRATVGSTHLPPTSLLSDNFMTRAFTVLGHSMTAGLVVAIPFYVLVFIFARMFSR